jgi:hypothetical protein
MMFLFATPSRPALRPTQPPIKWVPAAFSLEVKRPGREADHSPQSSARFKATRVYPKLTGLAAWSENCKWYSFLPLVAILPLFCESV